MSELKLFQWYDTLIVATDRKDAVALLKEQYTASKVHGYPVEAVEREVELLIGGDDGEVQTFTPSDAAQLCGRGIVPSP